MPKADNPRAVEGDNSKGDVAETGVAGDEIKSFIERIERLEAEKADLGSDIKEVYAELKGRGFDAKVVRRLIALRKQDMAEREGFMAVLELYAQALGMDSVFA